MKSVVRAILWLSTPIQKIMQQMGAAEKRIDFESVTHLVTIISHGTILLSYERQRFTSFFIKGEYKHAALVASNGKVVEAVGDEYRRHRPKKWYHLLGPWIRNPDGTRKNYGGVREVNLIEWLYKKDAVAVLDVLCPETPKKLAAANALAYLHRGYDYQFSYSNDLVWCSELPYLCFSKEWAPFFAEFNIDKQILPIDYLRFANFVPYIVVKADMLSPNWTLP